MFRVGTPRTALLSGRAGLLRGDKAAASWYPELLESISLKPMILVILEDVVINGRIAAFHCYTFKADEKSFELYTSRYYS